MEFSNTKRLKNGILNYFRLKFGNKKIKTHYLIEFFSSTYIFKFFLIYIDKDIDLSVPFRALTY